MTHSGGKPHRVGDHGQRFEVRAEGYPKPGWCVIGWTNELGAARRMEQSIQKAPSCTRTMTWDRKNNEKA